MWVINRYRSGIDTETVTRRTIRKQELAHLHELFVEVTQSLIDRGALPSEIRSEYEALDTNAYAIHAPKAEHRKAVLLLAATVAAEIEQSTEEQPALSAS